MKEHRELQTKLDELERYIAQTADIEQLRIDAARHRWLTKYTAQLFMCTPEQVNEQIDKAMRGGI